MKKTLIAITLCLVLCLSLASSAMAQTVTFGSYGYQPLYWDVLYSNSQYTTLISDSCVACRPYGSGSNWYSSDLRSWLNNSFLYSAFSSSERNAMYFVDGDQIRIPSVGDVTNSQYGFSSNRKAQDYSRSASASAAAINQGVWTNRYGYCSYYTLTACDSTSVYQVCTDGTIGVAGVARDNVGVRVMITVQTSALY